MDRLIVAPSAIEIQGWAYIEGYNAENNRVYIVLKSTRKTYIFDTFTLFENPLDDQNGGYYSSLDWSGFMTTISLRKIEKGDYTLGFYIIKEEIEALQYTNKVISKSHNEVKLLDSTSNITPTLSGINATLKELEGHRLEYI